MSLHTRDRLLEAAKQLFSEKGYHETRVSDIVSKAEVAQGTFYIYFKSKEDIFLQLIKKIHKELLDKLSKYKEVSEEPQTVLGMVVDEFLEEVYKNRELSQIFFGQLLGINEEFRQLYIKKISDIQQILKDILSKFYDQETSAVLSTLVLGFLRQLFFNCLIEKNLTLEQMKKKASTVLDIINRGVYPEVKKF
ncbi:MAG: TetR/AcrR family transcriptional regulator [Hydrogenothermaceae bacterium]